MKHNHWMTMLFASLIVFLILLGAFSFGIINPQTQEDMDFFVSQLLFVEVVVIISIIASARAFKKENSWKQS